MNVRDEMLAKLNRRKAGYSLDREFYSDPDFFQVDMETIYYRDWLFMGHDCELPKSGSYMTVQIGAYPIVIVRDAKKGIRAFHNSCRHRGSRICSAEKGTSHRLVCPYHQWTYDLEGKLVFARDMGPDFDPSQFGLRQVHCESVGGYIFVSLADEAPDFTPVRAMVEPYLAPHHLADAKVAFEMTIIEKGNWKLTWENNRECYHCAGSHPELCRTFPEAPGVTGVDAQDEPEIAEHWQRCEAAALPSAFKISDDGQYRVARMPLLRDAVSFTMSGKAAVSRPLCDTVTTPQIGTMLMFHYPSIWNHILGDHATTFRVLPLSANETAVTTKWLVHKDAVEGVDYTIDELTKVWIATNDQDRRIIEENQFGINSPAYQPGPYSPVHEGGVLQFVEWYSAFMQTRLTDSRRPRLSQVA